MKLMNQTIDQKNRLMQKFLQLCIVLVAAAMNSKGFAQEVQRAFSLVSNTKITILWRQ